MSVQAVSQVPGAQGGPRHALFAAALSKRGLRSFLPWLNLAGLLAILVVAWAVPGPMIAMLATIPIFLASMGNSRTQLLLTSAVAIAGLALAALFGRPAVSPDLGSSWLLAFLTLPVSSALALLIQQRRLEALQARDEALSASDLNRLLTSLLAHDLRSPMILASQALDYVEESLASDSQMDERLLHDVRGRLRHSLEKIEAVLALARREAEGALETQVPCADAAVQLRREIEAEIRSFEQEASAQRKVLVTDLEELGDQSIGVDVGVLRQALACVVDNAIRHARPGMVRVSAGSSSREVFVRVEDEGPGLKADVSALPGSGLGLPLCRALLGHAGGRLDLERNQEDGTSFVLRLPVTPVAGAGLEV